MVVSYTSIAIKSLLWNASSASWGNRKRKRTDQDIVHCNNCTVNTNDAIYNFLVPFTLTSGEMVETISHETWPHLALSLDCLFYANSVINPLLYALKIPEFKRALFL